MERETSWYIVFLTQMWFDGVLYQGNRLIEASKQHGLALYKLFSPHAEDQRQLNHQQLCDECDKLRNSFEFEKYFFIQAIDRSIDLLNYSKKNIFPDISSIIEGLGEVIDFSVVEDIRNMNVHDIAYMSNNGRKQERFLHSTDKGIADATSTIIDENGIMIGNRLNVVLVVNKYTEMSPQMHKICNEFLFSNNLASHS